MKYQHYQIDMWLEITEGKPELTHEQLKYALTLLSHAVNKSGSLRNSYSFSMSKDGEHPYSIIEVKNWVELYEIPERSTQE